ncbi:MAG TPA: hypothetical protein PKI05_02235 [Thermogutta sp.]|nr:hypothetical protein [Thermogutta sp.]HOP77379.1 hypothetical protein [Thermogutta sp.]HPU06921.1 hypothetical protein [Thermogutta sp.]
MTRRLRVVNDVLQPIRVERGEGACPASLEFLSNRILEALI